MINKTDIEQIKEKGIDVEKIERQVAIFKKGVPYMNLVRSATVNDGILRIEEEEEVRQFFLKRKDDLQLVKFVPASGAATRMFKVLFKFLSEFDDSNETFNSYRNKQKDNAISMFFVGLEKFPFYNEVLEKTKELYPGYESFSDSKRKYCFVKTFLTPSGLNYGSYPKGLFPFHQYKDHNATAFEEHLFEAALYVSGNKKARLHFTISPEHLSKFEDEFKRIENIVETKTETTFDISFSHQKPETDTVAVTLDNDLFRDEDGKLLLRPGGHGALIENLNMIDADLIFVKNIDNVVVFKYEQEVAKYKQILAGKLLQIQEKVFTFLEQLDKNEVDDHDMVKIEHFILNELNGNLSMNFSKFSRDNKIQEFKEVLNRPIRVCGMVKNEGEPGGGPFWVKKNGEVSLQIVESAQIDKKNKEQKAILKESTHFNPVDLVCGVRNYKGQKFDLLKYIDNDAVFITPKTKNGKDLKALELPGLWNGAMAYWNTIFVEVPLLTFNPVKTVNDLLKAAHQVK